MKSTVEAIEANRVKLTVEISEDEFEQDIDAAFRRLAKEVRLPGFRPGKAPRKVLEARIGKEYARADAFEHGIGRYYGDAVREHDVDVVASPEIDITEGLQEGAVTFDAVVEVRPLVEISGYDDLSVEVDSIEFSDDELDEAQERFLRTFGTLVDADRPAEDGDTLTIDIETTHDGEPVPGMTTDSYSYKLGSGSIVPELDAELLAAEPGDSFDFAAEHPDPDEEEPLHFSVTVAKVQRVETPEPTPEFMQENSEFETIEEMRQNYVEEMRDSKIRQADQQRRHAILSAIADLVDDDAVTDALIENEVGEQIQNMASRMQQSGLSLTQFIQMTGQSEEEFVDGIRMQAPEAVKTDLALRAIATQQGLIPDDAKLTDHLEEISGPMGLTAEAARQRFDDNGMLSEVRWGLAKSDALDWLVERTTVTDRDGNEMPTDAFVVPDPGDDDAVAEPPEEGEVTGTLGDAAAPTDTDDTSAGSAEAESSSPSDGDTAEQEDE